jgi:hypothetical protein
MKIEVSPNSLGIISTNPHQNSSTKQGLKEEKHIRVFARWRPPATAAAADRMKSREVDEKPRPDNAGAVFLLILPPPLAGL